MKTPLLPLLAALFFACTPLPPQREAGEPAAEKEKPPAESLPEKAAPAIAPGSGEKPQKKEKKAGEPYAYTLVDSASMGNEIVLTPDKLIAESRTPEADSADDVSSGGTSVRIVDGFRIQVYATTNYLEAERKKEDLSSSVDDKVYVIYEAPYYKIRVGNFVKEEDAKKLKKVLTEMGHDVSIVKTKIRSRQ